MTTPKREIARSVEKRRAAALQSLLPQWRKCFWTRPFGHIHDGSTGTHHYYKVCLYCGRPEWCAPKSVVDLEKYTREASMYPIARGAEKRAVTA